ncbi:SURF1 family protein [uncultured Methylobacterium sp.]|uniref:SURF1 family protein n=1 Tax=uncultured Methylobacterium sp. TaxID=157278 RepID=UPI0035C99568
MGDPVAGPAPRRRSPLRLSLLGLAAILVFATLVGLGTWQVQRRAWKLDLVARVEARIHAAPVAAPARPQWPGLSAASDEYRRIRAEGRFLHDRETLVQAVTDRGGGYWVMTPLVQTDGTTILVNRGFAPSEWRDLVNRTPGPAAASVVGLLRLAEPGGAFLRRNDPAAGRWYSRDVAAIAAARGLADTAPYFIDADATPNAGGLPVGGLTVVAFQNNHLVYAATWYALALMVLAAAWLFVREERRRPHRADGEGSTTTR